MKAKTKLSGEQRHAAIIRAVRRVFAENGFHGTTSKALAVAAGVSEALLFKHFPNKEALYAAMQVSCCNDQTAGEMERIKSLDPSTATLVSMIRLMVGKMVGSGEDRADDAAIHHRLMLRSLAEDGEFARLFLQRVVSNWLHKVEECIKAAVAAGDVVSSRVSPRLGAWFAHHLAALVMCHLFPPNPVVDYGVSTEVLIEQVTCFALRGIGLKEDVIKRHGLTS